MTTTKGQQLPLTIIIPAAGPCRRMKSAGPKSLIPINNETIIDRQLRLIHQIYPKAEIVVVCGFMAAKVMNYLPDYVIKVENEKFEENNVVRSIGMGLRASRGGIIGIVYGDLVFNKYALPINLSDSLLVLDQPNGLMKSEEVGINSTENKAEIVMYNHPQKWAQIAFFKDKELKMLKERAFNDNKRNLFGFEIINEIILAGGNFKTIMPNNIRICDVDYNKDIEIAKTI